MRASPILVLATCFMLSSCASTQSPPSNPSEADAHGTSVLEQAVIELPSEAVADIPRSQRAIFLSHLRSDEPSNPRLDIESGFLEFYSDGETPFLASSMLYMKVLPKKDGGSIVFCHMPKPQADGLPPRPGQTFFFARRDGKWVDVTSETLPDGVDILWLFRHSRHSLVLQAGPYKVWKKTDGTETCGGDGVRLMDLVWDGTSFHLRTAKSPEFKYDE